MAQNHSSSPQPSKPIRIEGREKITVADGVPPITVNWETSEDTLRTEMVLESGDARSASVIEIPMGTAHFPNASGGDTHDGNTAPAASSVDAPPAVERPIARESLLSSGGLTPDASPLSSDAPASDESPLQPDDTIFVDEPLENTPTQVSKTNYSAEDDPVNSIDEPSLAVLPITPSALQPTEPPVSSPQQGISTQTTQSFSEARPLERPLPSIPVMPEQTQYNTFDGEMRELSIPAEKLDKKGRPKKRHRVRNIIIAVIVVFLLYEIGGVVLSPLILPYSSVGTEALPATFGDAANSNQERIMYMGDDNEAALSWRLKIISEAKHEICFESLDLRGDESGSDLMAALYAAADRGVHERIIVDGITALIKLKTDPVFAELYNHPNVEVKFYNEPNLLTPWTLNYRLHEKVVKVDDTFLVVGGRNSMNYFLGNYSGTKKLDRDILVYNLAENSDLMQTVQRHFDAYWNYDKCTDASPWASPSNTLTDRWMSLVASDASILENRTWTDLTYPVNDVAFITGGTEATNKEPTLWKSICEIAATGNDVIIQTPYVMFSDEMYSDLTTLSMSRTVRIVTNDITDHTNAFGTMDLTHERGNILATGATLVEVQWPSFVHAKAFVVDNDISLIGSFNCDSRSAYLDNECMLVIKSTTLNEQLRSEIRAGKDVGYVQTATSTTAGPEYDLEKRENNSVFWEIAGFITQPIRYLF